MLQVSEVVNAGADLTNDAGKSNKNNDDMKISEKEEHHTVEYKETLKTNVKHFNRKKDNMETNI